MPTNYLYIRTSTKEQRYGLETQKVFLRDHILTKHINNKNVFVTEQLSGKTLEVRLLNDLLDSLSENDVLYAYDVSRLTRANEPNESISAITQRVFKKNAKLVIGLSEITKDNYEQELQLVISGAVATYQRKVQNEKSRAGIKAKKIAGEWIYKGNLYGYLKGKDKITVVEDEAKIIHYIFSEFLTGKSYLKIANQLIESGVKYRDHKWYQSYIRRIINNPIYSGCYYLSIPKRGQKYNGQELIQSKEYPAIISTEEWKKAQDNDRTIKRTHARQFSYRYSAYDLAGIVTCGYCLDAGVRSSYVHAYVKRKDKDYSTYCNRVHIKSCHQEIKSINEQVLNQLVFISFIAFLSNGIEIQEYIEKIEKDNNELISALRLQLKEKEQLHKILEIDIDNIADTLIGAKDSKLLFARLQDKIAMKEKEFENVKNDIEKMKSTLIEASSDGVDRWDRLDQSIDFILYKLLHESKRDLYKKYIQLATIKDGKLDITYVNGKYISIALDHQKGRRNQREYYIDISYKEKEQYTMKWSKDSNQVSLSESDNKDRFTIAQEHRLYGLFMEIYSKSVE